MALRPALLAPLRVWNEVWAKILNGGRACGLAQLDESELLNNFNKPNYRKLKSPPNHIPRCAKRFELRLSFS